MSQEIWEALPDRLKQRLYKLKKEVPLTQTD